MPSTNNTTGSTQITRLEHKLYDELNKIKGEVDDLYETVYKGNGTPSLVTRVNSIEGQLRGLREQMDEKISHLSRENTLKFEALHQKLESKFGRLEGWIETKFGGMEDMLKSISEAKNVDRSGSWQMKVATLTALTAIATGILTYLLK